MRRGFNSDGPEGSSKDECSSMFVAMFERGPNCRRRSTFGCCKPLAGEMEQEPEHMPRCLKAVGMHGGARDVRPAGLGQKPKEESSSGPAGREL